MIARARMVPAALVLALVAWLEACGPVPAPRPPAPPPISAELADRSCRDIWQQELLRPIDPPALRDCVARFLAGATGEAVRASVRASAEWKDKHPPTPPAPVYQARPGLVRASGAGLEDDAGPRLFVGTSLFWSLWGELHDRARLDANLEAIAKTGAVDFIRVFAQVGGASWADRAVGPADPGWKDAIRSLTDRAYDRYGLRVEWTILAWADGLPTKESRAAAVDGVLEALDGRAAKVFAIEIANEGFANGPDPLEAKQLAGRVRARFPGLVATSAPQGDSCEAQAPWYAGAGASLVTLHFDRSVNGAGGYWRPVRQPWRESVSSCDGLPRAYLSNEPIGPGSSVAADDEPIRLVANAAVSFVAAVGAYVLHTDAGIRGGGAADLARGRVANVWQVSRWLETTAGLKALRAALPPDLARWARAPSSKPPMFEVREFNVTVDRVYCTTAGPRFVCVAFNLRPSSTFTAKRGMAVRVVHPLTGAELEARTLAAGDTITIGGDPGAVVLVGQ